jgi:hypothetical protein
VKYIVFVIDKATNTGDEAEMKAISAFNQELEASGQLIFAAGIGAPDTASVHDFVGDNSRVTPGSLFSTEFFYSGFWIVDVEGAKQAASLAARASKACNRRVELRPFLGS